MGKQSRARTVTRTRLAEVRAAQAQQERRRRLVIAVGAICAVLVIAGGLVVLRAAGVGGQSSSGSPATAASPQVVSAVSNVPPSVLDSIGAGDAKTLPRSIQAPALTADGKPRVLYVGAEYCPYCAAQRWAMAVALSRFGSWSGLEQTHSSSSDVFPNTPTLSFHGAHYTSRYLSFTGYETTTNELEGNHYQALDTPSPADQKIFETYDQPPYTDGSGGIPFLDIGGSYVLSGASFSPQVLSGMTQEQVAAALSDPASPVAKAVDGAANALTAAICNVTKGSPAGVCDAAGVRAAAQGLAGG
jgi:Domain of unknown function (DUF929)